MYNKNLKAYVGAVGATKLTAIFVMACILGVSAFLAVGNVFAETTGYLYTTNAEGIDQYDFAPGDIVYIHGMGFSPSSPVEIYLLRPPIDGVELSPETCTVDSCHARFLDGLQYSNEEGDLVYRYDLNGVEGLYTVKATTDGGLNFIETTFTDSRQVDSVRLNGGTPWTNSNNGGAVTVAPGATISVQLTVTTNGGSDWLCTQWDIEGPGNSGSDNFEPDHTSDGQFVETFDITAPATAGTYDLFLQTRSNDACNEGSSGSINLNNAIIVQTQPVCGDGIINGNDVCDDGNTANGDGCSSVCLVESGWSCTGQPSVCTVVNPTLSSSCGIDMALVIDVSGSIDSTEIAQMKSALSSFVDAFLPNTPTKIAVVKFDTTATIIHQYSNDATSLKNAINGASGGGYTNWQDALYDTHTLYDHRLDKPDLYVFASDGEPNRYGDPATTATTPVAVAHAVTEANHIKLHGIRIITLGIGTGGSSSLINNLKAISSADAYYDTNFETIADDLAALANQLCGGTVSVKKLVDGQPAANWVFTTSVTGGTSTPTTSTTDVDGFINPLFDIEAGGGTATVDVTETPVNGYGFVSASCVNQNQQSVGSCSNGACTGISVGPNDAIYCVFNNQYNACSGYTNENDCNAQTNRCQWCEQCSSPYINGLGIGFCYQQDNTTACNYNACAQVCGAACDENRDCLSHCDGLDYYKLGVCGSGCTCSYTQESCDDANLCTNDFCDANGCYHTDVVCNDNNPCTQDTCDPSSGCVFDAVPMNGYACSDGLYCNGQETCNNGICSGNPVCCDSNDITGVATCNNDPDNYPPTWDYRAAFDSHCVEDGNNQGHCTTGDSTITHTCDVPTCNAECDATHGCADKCVGNVWNYGGICDSSQTCTCSYTTENCDSKDGWYCADTGREYRDYSCGPSGCTYIVTNTESCDDGNQCTNDFCSGEGNTGTCQHTPKELSTPCSDGLYCNGDDHCNGQGLCVPLGTPVNCSRLNGQCQVGVCSEATDQCVPDYSNFPLSTPCNNDLYCDGSDHCDGLGSCVNLGPPINCDDQNPCTADRCDESDNECVHAFSDTEGPQSYNVLIDPTFNNGVFNLTGTAKDKCSNIKISKYYLGTGIGSCDDYNLFSGMMDPADGNYDQLLEDLKKLNLQYRYDGQNFACIKSWDVLDNVGNCNCTYFDTDVLPPDCPYDIYLDDVKYPDEYMLCGNNAWLNATVCDSQSPIQGGEYFIDPLPGVVPEPWSGIWMNVLQEFIDGRGWHCAIIGAAVNTSQLSDGTHYIKIRGKDIVENWGKFLQCQNVSFIRDTTPPLTTKTMTSVKHECTTAEKALYGVSDCWFVKGGMQITLTAHDFNPDNGANGGYNDLPGEYSDNVKTYYQIGYKLNWEDEWQWSAVTEYTGPFTLDQDSFHKIKYWSEDGCDNAEAYKYELDIVDTKYPDGFKTVGEPNVTCGVEENCDYWVRDHVTPITLNCIDQQPHPSDHEKMCYRISFDAPQTPYLTSQYCSEFQQGGYMEGDWCCVDKYAVTGAPQLPYTFTFTEDSLHDLEYYCEDVLGNRNTPDVEYFRVDSVPPEIIKGIEGPSYGTCPPQTPNDICFLDGVTNITVQMSDPDPTGRNCNVGGVTCEWGYYLDDNYKTFYGWYSTFPVHFPEETTHELHIRCRDALGNEMTEDVETFYVDKTPPVITKSYVGPQYLETTGGDGNLTVDILGTAGNFAILSKTGITDVPTSAITGDVGTSPITGAAITGLECAEVNGTIYTVDDAGPPCRVIDPVLLTAAVSDMEAAYTDLAGRTPDYTGVGSGDISGMTLTPGIYKWTTGLLINTGGSPDTNGVTLDCGGNASSIFIFQIAGNLAVGSGAKVTLSGDCQASNIFWQVAGTTTLGTTSVFNGNILAGPDASTIALLNGATLNGRALGQTDVTLIANIISLPDAATTGNTSGNETPRWITSGTNVTLSVYDAGPHKSGIKETKYRVTLMPDNSYCEDQTVCEGAQGTGAWTDYTVPFTIADDSCHLIEYYSKDNVEKTDGVHKQCVYVDNKKPETVKTISDTKIPGPVGSGIDYYITKNNVIELNCTDQQPHPVDHVTLNWELYWAYDCFNPEPNWQLIDSGSSDGYKSFTNLDDSCHKLVYYCADVLGNTESTWTEIDVVDNQAPNGTKDISDPKIPCENGDEITGPVKVLILHSNFEQLVADVVNKLSAYPDLQVSTYSVASQTPTLGQLMQYDSVLVYTNMMPYDPVALGNVLADYADTGGGVVLASFDWYDGFMIQGRFMTQGYGSMPMGASGNVYSPGVLGAYNPVHPVMNGVSSFSTGSFRSGYVGPLNPGATLVASYMDQQVLVAVNEAHGKTCDLGFFPPSADVCYSGGFCGWSSWDSSTDGDLLMHNCLTWTAGEEKECDYWVRDHVTNITLDCTDAQPHPIEGEVMCYQIKFDNVATPDLTQQYCTQFGGNMDNGWCCADVAGEKNYKFDFQEDSVHTLEYYCRDAFNNQNLKDLEKFKVDSVPPTTTKEYVGPFYDNGTSHWIDTVSTVKLTETDGGAICAVDGTTTYYAVTQVEDSYCYDPAANCQQMHTYSDQVWNIYENEFSIAESCHLIEFYSVDALGNTEAIKHQCVFSDHKVPVTTKTYGTPLVETPVSAYPKWITSDTEITLTAVDQQPHPSGVNVTKYRYFMVPDSNCEADGYCGPMQWLEGQEPAWITYDGTPFKIPEDSCHQIEYYSVDNVDKTENIKRQCVYVDNQPPNSTKTFDGFNMPCDQLPCRTEGDCDYYINQDTKIVLTCEDAQPHPVDDVKIYYRYFLDDVLEQDWTLYNPQNPIQYDEDSKHTLDWYCVDALGNTEATHTQTERVDTTPPETNKTIGDPNWDEGYWVTSDTPITLTVEDGGAICAAGPATLYYQVWWDHNCDGTVDTKLVDSYVQTDANCNLNKTIYFNKECLNEIRWYAVDALGNEENGGVWITQQHKVDNTPPHILILKPVDGWYSSGEDIPIVADVKDLNNANGPCESHGQNCNELGTNCSVGIADGAQCYAYLVDVEFLNTNPADNMFEMHNKVDLITDGTFLYNAAAHQCQGYATVPDDESLHDGIHILVVSAKDNLGNMANSFDEIKLAINEACGWCWNDPYDLCEPECVRDVLQDIITSWNLPKIGIDNHAPVVTITAPTENSLFGGEQVFVSANVSDSEDGQITSTITSGTPCYISIGGVSMGTVPYDNVARKCVGTVMIPEDSDFPQGTQALKVEIADNAGNLGSDSINVNVDTVKPVLSIIIPSQNQFVKGTIEVTAQVSDANLDASQIKISTDNGQTWHDTWYCNPSTYCYDWDTTLETDGMAYGIVAKATDLADNTGYSEVVIVIVDNGAPEGVYIVDPVKDEIVGGTITLKALATDYVSGVDSVEIYVNSVPSFDCDATLVGGTWECNFDTTTFPDGQHTAYAVATDNMGQTTTSASVPFIIDNDAPSTPVLSIYPATNGYDTDGVVTWQWTDATDVGSGIDYYLIEIGSPVVYQSKVFGTMFTISDLSEMSHCAKVKAVDKAGRESAWSSTACTIVDKTPPSPVSIGVDTETVDKFVGGVYYDTDGEFDVIWSGGSDANFDHFQLYENGAGEYQNSNTRSTRYKDDGTYKYYVTSNDLAGWTTSSGEITVVVDTQDPSIVVSEPTGFMGLWTFTYSASDPAPSSGIDRVEVSGADTDFVTCFPEGWCMVLGGTYVELTVYDKAGNSDSANTNGAPADTTPPEITLTTPSGVIDYNNVVLYVNTDEPASCSYGTFDYIGSMLQMNGSGTTEHSANLGTLADGLYVYHVRCQDGHGNTMDHSKTIVFYVNTVGQYCYSTDMNAGWNTFFLPQLILDDINFNCGVKPYATEDVLASLYDGEGQPLFEAIYYYNGHDWDSYVPGDPVNDLKDFSDILSNPYYIKLTEPARLGLQCEDECVSNYCGDGIVNGEEQCETPDDTHNAYCTQTTQQCQGTHTQYREALGYCNTSCGCVETEWGSAQCVKDSCGATCSVNEDCAAEQYCNSETCQCQYIND